MVGLRIFSITMATGEQAYSGAQTFHVIGRCNLAIEQFEYSKRF